MPSARALLTTAAIVVAVNLVLKISRNFVAIPYVNS